MISIYNPSYQHASNAVDDVTVCTDGLSTAHTKREFSPWIKIDLQDVFDVAEVLAYNRQDAFGLRLHDLLITVDGNHCGFFKGPAARGDRILFLCPSGSVGRYVKLMIQSAEGEEDILCVCELQVYVQLSEGSGWGIEKM
ncbi:fucolectin-7-like [Saccostrea cucullata]|uniref:fucolectin-7-like n=1 Tax=Saccostrea cuccullata TaxID=36930 RepID=UPI002ED137E0